MKSSGSSCSDSAGDENHPDGVGEPDGSVTLRPTRGNTARPTHDRNEPGLNHISFNADSRTDVDNFYVLLKQISGQVLDPPAEYACFPGYFAVCFTDPDGIKIEVVHWPSPGRHWRGDQVPFL
jgi:glyoxylase I family protein